MKQGTGNGEQGSEPNTPFQRQGIDAARKGGIGGMPPETESPQ
jgi:hypothetical protein